jgi:tRNA (cmo5U34)-methyltransferase
MAHKVRAHLRLGNDEYDEAIRRFIPGYEQMLSIAAAQVASVRPGHVLDLGAGTGALSAAMLEQSGVGVVELLDVDPEMMERARARLDRWGERVVFTLGSIDEPLRPADAMAASLSLHHIPTIEAKSVLFARVFESLREGGVLVIVDANVPRDREVADRLYRSWAAHLVSQGISESRAWRHFEEWAEEDTYLPLEEELAALGRVGFDAECVWQDGPMGVIAARKAGR